LSRKYGSVTSTNFKQQQLQRKWPGDNRWITGIFGRCWGRNAVDE